MRPAPALAGLAGALLGSVGLMAGGPAWPRDVAFYFEAPAGDRYVTIDPTGETVLPNGRLITPLGRQIDTAPHPYGLALSGDGRLLVTVNGGAVPFALTVIRDPESDAPQVVQSPPRPETDKRRLPSAFLGVAIDSARDLVYASTGDDGTVAVFSLATGARILAIDLSTAAQPDAFTSDLALSPDGRWLYALDIAHYRLVVIDTIARQAVASVGVGRNPFALVLTHDGRRAFVANTGTFQYSLVETREGDDERGLPFPPFGYPSQEARDGTLVDGRRVPGLGDPNVPEACSVWSLDLSNPLEPKVTDRIKTGLPVGQAIGGSGPSGLALSENALYVTNATNDTVEAYDLGTHRRRFRTSLAPAPFLERLRGVSPFGLALSPDGSRLYVAESGINAVAVLDAASGEVLGHIPTAWYPARVAVSPNGRRLYITNAKGYGAGPNGGPGFRPGKKPDPEQAYVGRLMRGTVSLVEIPADGALAAHTQRVLANNGLVPRDPGRGREHPIPALPGVSSPVIRHVVMIAKENRTFDEVFGDFPGVNGLPELARFGAARRVGAAEDVTVMPNHRALAQRFAISDNFYVDSDASADGHRWLVGAYPNHWVETVTSAGYGGGAKFGKTSGPGRLSLFESNSSLTPEDYLEAGSMWEHLERGGITFRNFGEGFEFAGADEDEDTLPTGARLPVNVPMPDALFRNTEREFPGFNTNIPDQYRVDVFLRALKERWLSGREPFPRFVYILLPNDHGTRPRADKGYPFLESYMADNDLALGRLIETLSSTPFWKETAVLVTEDDAQNGVDHVDAHRSLCLAIGPWVKRGYVSHRHTSIASVTKTIYRVLGLPHLHLYDAAASDLADMFTTTPDFAPYRALPVDSRVFDPAKARDPKDPEYRAARAAGSDEMDGADEALRQLPHADDDDDDRRRGRPAARGAK